MDLFKNNYWIKDNGKSNPPVFPYFGIIGFCGKQGSGKTYSAVKLTKQLSDNYNIRVLSNLEIAVPNFEIFYGMEQLFSLIFRIACQVDTELSECTRVHLIKYHG